MEPIRIVRCLCGTLQTEIDMGDFTKDVALTSKGGKSHSRGEAIIAKTGVILGYNIDIERKVEFEVPYQPNKDTRNQWQSQVDVVFSNMGEKDLALIEYESTDLIESTIDLKINKWRCFFPNKCIKLLCVVIISLFKKKLEQSWELKDRSILVTKFQSRMKEVSRDFPENAFSIIAVNDESIVSYYFEKGKEKIQDYNLHWR